ncbi:MAG: N-acetylmuramoyl-L-alanine amidase [Helicobacteraceae bacterium]|jgi:N-acetylmuramoyl-L-alanine amidase|nr:N-acetylmuramoyl-L-alanine amidase [Helicobacteraceae bacterium]
MEKIAKFVVVLLAFFAVSLDAQKITRYQLERNRLIVEFESPLSPNDINDFIIKPTQDEPFRRVIDVKASYPHKPLIDTKTADAGVKIAQFNAEIARIVLSREDKFDVAISILANTLTIEFETKRIALLDGYKPIVAIDAGHGGRDTGALGVNKTKEKDIALKVAVLTAKILRDRGFEVEMTRENDKYVALQSRTSLANKIKADIFVSIHANACPPPYKLSGIETYFLSPAKSDRAKEVAALENSVVVDNMEKYSKEAFLNFLNREMVVSSNKLAIDIQRSLLFYARQKYAKTIDGGIREGPFWVLTGAQMPAALVEIGYITHKDEVKRLLDPSYQRLLAEGIALGIESYFINNFRR